jgi:2-amino-4-hydroxy-6-hydroxymethyldihydropteridine diphosphokinase
VIAIVGAGSNLGSRFALLRGAARRLDGLGVRVERTARFVATPALVLPGQRPGPDFVNTAFRVRFAGSLEALLDVLLRVERELGRVRTERWGARTLDLDILVADHALQTPRLVVPHPALPLRNFALAPLLDVAPELERTYRRFLREPPRLAIPDALDRRLRVPTRAIVHVEPDEVADVDAALAALGETPGAILSTPTAGEPCRFVRFVFGSADPSRS